MKEAVKEKSPSAEAGLHLNKKSVIGICILLTLILIFAGALTQLLPRGEYYTYPLNTYKLSDGSIISQFDAEQVYKINGNQRLSAEDYNQKLKSEYNIDIQFVDSLEGYDIESAEDLSEMIIADTYHKIDFRMPIWKIPLAMLLVFGTSDVVTGIGIIVIIILIGGTFLILDEQSILKYIMAVIINKFEKKKYILLCAVVFVCMLLSSTAGILEESVTLVPICCAIALALGWDSLVGLSISLVAIAFGFTAATFNPFNVVTVQKLAGIPVFSGLWMRILMFILVYAVLVSFIVIYAKKIEKNPEKSYCYETDKALREKFKLENSVELLSNQETKKATKAFVLCISGVLLLVVVDFIFSLGGMLSLPGMGILFTVGGLSAGYISGVRGKELFKGFARGVKAIAPAIPMIFFILGITYILREGMIVHTILYSVYNLISGFSPYGAILLLFSFIIILEFFIGSGTAKAFLVMPIVAPLASLIGLSGNSVVLTFCMGDGFTNLLYPTSSIMIIAIGLVNISYGKWLKYTWKLFLAEGILAVAIMHFALFVNYA